MHTHVEIQVGMGGVMSFHKGNKKKHYHLNSIHSFYMQ